MASNGITAGAAFFTAKRGNQVGGRRGSELEQEHTDHVVDALLLVWALQQCYERRNGISAEPDDGSKRLLGPLAIDGRPQHLYADRYRSRIADVSEHTRKRQGPQ